MKKEEEMGIKLEEYDKGDIYFEICVERSTIVNDVTITLWKRSDSAFQVGIFRVGDRLRAMRNFKKYENDKGAWREYEKCCAETGCSPYPKADE
jgi:hypothetical protein